MIQKKLLTPALLASAIALSPMAVQAEGETFVHLFEWQWNDIATECTEFLGPKGYKAVQVSPPQEHIQGDTWWTRYQPVKHELSASRGGSVSEFINMVNVCKDAGVDIYVDAIINHTAGGAGVGTAGNSFDSNSRVYPQYSAGDFHLPTCEIAPEDYGNDAWRVRNCSMPGLPDLNTADPYVRSVLSDYMTQLTDLGVAGFRIDAAKHMLPSDIEAILSTVAPNTYVFQEVIDNGGEKTSASEYLGVGDVTEFKYSGALSDRFLNGGVSDLLQMESWGFLQSDEAVVFTDNHDNQRGHGGGGDIVTYKNGATYELANVFMLAFPYGYPKVMSSYAFDNTDAGPPSSAVHLNGQLNCFGSQWQCEHRKTSIANMVAFRNFTSANSFVTDVWQNGTDQIAFGRGSLGFVVINRSGSVINETLQTQLPAGEYCNVTVSDTCDNTLTVSHSGSVTVSVAPWSTAAIHGGAMVNAKPTAEISPLPAQVALNTVLTLDGSSSFDSEGYITAYAWSNGSVTDTTTVVLNTEGEQCFTLLVTNNSNATDTETACTWVGERPPVSNFKQAYFRGTSNGWQATSMTLIADNTWSVTISFTGEGDSTGTQRFKIDRFGDWAENYGDNGQDGLLDQAGEDILFTGVGTFDVRFNDETMLYSFETSGNQAPIAEITSQKTAVKVGEAITLDGTRSSDIDGHVTDYVWSNGSKAATTVFASQIAGDFEISLMVKDDLGKESLTEAVIHITVEKESNGFISQYPSMAARGTFNGWSVSPMFLIADNIWSIEITFAGNASPDRFKFDAYGDWQTNFGDNYADGSLEQNGDDILVTTPGTYILELNELEHSYSINKKAQ